MTERKIMRSAWGFQPDHTDWVLDEQALDDHELIETRTVPEAYAQRLSDVVIDTLALAPPYGGAANPIRVEPGPIADTLAEIFGIDLDATAREYWLTVTQKDERAG